MSYETLERNLGYVIQYFPYMAKRLDKLVRGKPFYSYLVLSEIRGLVDGCSINDFYLPYAPGLKMIEGSPTLIVRLRIQGIAKRYSMEFPNLFVFDELEPEVVETLKERTQRND
jgi:hypothetical protein